MEKKLPVPVEPTDNARRGVVHKKTYFWTLFCSHHIQIDDTWMMNRDREAFKQKAREWFSVMEYYRIPRDNWENLFVTFRTRYTAPKTGKPLGTIHHWRQHVEVEAQRFIKTAVFIPEGPPDPIAQAIGLCILRATKEVLKQRRRNQSSLSYEDQVLKRAVELMRERELDGEAIKPYYEAAERKGLLSE